MIICLLFMILYFIQVHAVRGYNDVASLNTISEGAVSALVKLCYLNVVFNSDLLNL